MDKIVLNNNINLEFSKIEGLNITIEGKTIEELEKLFLRENLIKVQLVHSDGGVYTIYNNLECMSITKSLEESVIIVSLKQLDETVVRLNTLEGAINDLGTAISSIVEGK